MLFVVIQTKSFSKGRSKPSKRLSKNVHKSLSINRYLVIFLFNIHAIFAPENVTQEYELRHEWQKKDESRTSSWKPGLLKKKNMQLEELLRKPLWQMTGEEFLYLQNSTHQGDNYVPAPVAETSKKRYEYGIRGIAKIFGCSIPTANRIKKSGKINAAITQVGRKIIVDADQALELAQDRSSCYKKGGK